MEKENQLDKNDGAQLVIQSNQGTINIHNHVNDNTKAVEAKRENEKEQNKIFANFLVSAKEIANKFMNVEEMAAKNRETEINLNSKKKK